MRRTKRIIDEEISKTRQLLGKVLVVGLFFRVKAKILQQQRLTFFELHSDLLRFGTHTVRAEAHIFAACQFLIQDHTQPLGNRLQTHLQIRFSFGPAQVRSENQSRSVPQRIFDGGQGFADTGVVHNSSVFQWNIEVDAHKDTVTVQREITNGKLGHGVVVLD